ncbi:hypothetical protein GOODEAATRI_021634, partial [Goodea atripinnis]
VILCYKLNFVLCSDSDTWQCLDNCGAETQTLSLSVVEEVSCEWCQREGAMTHLLRTTLDFKLCESSTFAPFPLAPFGPTRLHSLCKCFHYCFFRTSR